MEIYGNEAYYDYKVYLVNGDCEIVKNTKVSPLENQERILFLDADNEVKALYMNATISCILREDAYDGI